MKTSNDYKTIILQIVIAAGIFLLETLRDGVMNKQPNIGRLENKSTKYKSKYYLKKRIQTKP